MITGIQRVVRNLVEESYKLKSIEGYEVIPVIFFDNKLFRLPLSFLGVQQNTHDEYLGRCSFTLRVFEFCSKSKPYLYAKDKVRTHLYSLFIYIREMVHSFIVKQRMESNQLAVVEVTKGDIFILADVNWGRNIWSRVDEFRAQGVQVSMILYDLIRVVHPEFCGQRSSEEYVDFLSAALNKVDSILAISDAVKAELINYHHSNVKFKKPLPPIDYFHLGAELSESNGLEAVRGDLVKLFTSSENVYMVVSTIEPRKNHVYLIDTFDRLWEQGKNVKLLIIGRVGWMVEDLMKRINTHKEFGSRLVVFNDIGDAELAYCYRHAKALVFPSFTEGFGLPIIEALQNNLPVIASDIPVHREIAGDNVMYVDPIKPEELVDAINHIEIEGVDMMYMPMNFSWMSWQDATEEFLRKVIKVNT